MSPAPLTSANPPPSAHQGWVCRTYIWRGRGQRLSLSCQPVEHCSGTDCTSTSPRPPAPRGSAWPAWPPGSVPTLPCPRRLAPSAAAPQPPRCSSSTLGPLHGCALCQNTLPPRSQHGCRLHCPNPLHTSGPPPALTYVSLPLPCLVSEHKVTARWGEQLGLAWSCWHPGPHRGVAVTIPTFQTGGLKLQGDEVARGHPQEKRLCPRGEAGTQASLVQQRRLE